MNTEDNGTARVRVCTYLHASHTVSASLFVLILHGDCARFGFALRQILVQAIANLSILLRLLPQPVRVFGLTLEQHLEARLLLQIIPDFARGGAGIEGQWISTTWGTVPQTLGTPSDAHWSAHSPMFDDGVMG